MQQLTDILKFLASLAPNALFAAIGIAGAAAIFSIVQKSVSTFFRIPGLTGAPIPVAHKIAVIGLPGAGKTTLITGLFELIQRGADLDDVRLHGFQTIETVNRNIARLNSGVRIGPTKERDVFIFRFSYLKIRRFITRLYDVEIADFPGEYSDRISRPSPKRSPSRQSKRPRILEIEQESEASLANASEVLDEFNYALFNREFFSWIASAREYLFVIDLAAIYAADDARAKLADIMARIRTSWQVIEDASTDRALGHGTDREVHIVFTKVDALVAAYRSEYSIQDLLNTTSTGLTPPEKKVSVEGLRMKLNERRNTFELALSQEESGGLVQAIREDNNAVFADLIIFFTSRTKLVDVIYTSMTISEPDGSRLGVRKILKAVLP